MPAGDETDLDALLGDAPSATEQADDAAPAADAAEAPAEKTADAPTPTQPRRPSGPKKPWWDVYTAMLAVTLVAILVGCLVLLLEWSRYDYQTEPTTTSAPK